MDPHKDIFLTTLQGIRANVQGYSFEDFLSREDSVNPGDNIKYAMIAYAMSLPLELFGLTEEATEPDEPFVDALYEFFLTPFQDEITFKYGQVRLIVFFPQGPAGDRVSFNHFIKDADCGKDQIATGVAYNRITR
jgi:hypothetical protein